MGNMDRVEREQVQDSWMRDETKVRARPPALLPRVGLCSLHSYRRRVTLYRCGKLAFKSSL